MEYLIDGKAAAHLLKSRLAAPIGAFARQKGRVPGLAVVLVGDDPASQVYVGSKKKQTEAIGMRSYETLFDSSVSQERLLGEIDRLNGADHIDGILVQLPLPQHIDVRAVLERINPSKDVDGFHPLNVGRLVGGADSLVACTPYGSLLLLQSVLGSDFSGLHAVVVGRSDIVGKPMAQLLLQHHATVTIAHSRTRDLAHITQQGDIVVAAVGRPLMLHREHIREGAVVIDVGINRIGVEDGRSRLVGDVDFDDVADRVRAITPVPGGVGPMTIACLLHNTVKAAFLRAGLSFKPISLEV